MSEHRQQLPSEAEDNSGNVDTSYQSDITLHANGSATGAGLVDIVNGVGTIDVSDTVAETVFLSLEDTQTTGLNISSTKSVTFTSTAPIVSSGGGTSSRSLTNADFSGYVFPDAQLTLTLQIGSQTIPIVQGAVASSDGQFQLQSSEVPQMGGSHIFYLSVIDKEGQTTLNNVYDLGDIGPFVVRDIFLAPTIGLITAVVPQGSNLMIAGYASPNAKVILEIDGKSSNTQIQVGSNGKYQYSINTADISVGTHLIKAKQNNFDRDSAFSSQKVFTVTILSSVEIKTDLNNDGLINITDWSIFLSDWGATDPAIRERADLNGDGKVDITDFSIFIKTLKK